MNFLELMGQSDPPSDVKKLVSELLVRKAETREIGVGPLPDKIRNFVEGEFSIARSELEKVPARHSPLAKAEAEAFFREWVDRLGKP